MKAIQVKYVGPTDTRGARLKVCADGVRSIVLPYSHELSHEQMRADAARAMCAKYGWRGTLHGGAMADGSSVFVFEDARNTWPI